MADIYSVSHPQLTVIDGYYCQEGNGPSAGDVVKLDLILAGFDPVALDTTVCNIIALDPKRVLYIAKAEQKGLGTTNLDQFDFSGEELSSVKHPFKLPKVHMVSVALPKKLMDAIAKKLFKVLINFDPNKCKQCGYVLEKLSRAACLATNRIETGEIPRWNADKCITCYCCAELCPYEAVNFKVNIAKNVFKTWLGWTFVAIIVVLVGFIIWFK